TPAATLTDPADPGVYSWAMAPKPPSKDKVDPEVSFSWPGQQRRQDPGVLEARLAQRRQRQQPPEREQPTEPQPQREPQQQQQQPSGRAQLPARREDVTPSGARDRWIVTELRRQAVTTDTALRDINERLDQLSRTMRQIVDYLPRLQQRGPSGVASGAAGQHAEAVLAQRIDELETRIEARFDELAGAASK